MKRKIAVIALPILAVTGFIILRTNLDFFLGLLPDGCAFYLLTGMQCFACGNTRSVMSLLNGDIISALKFNPTIPVLCVVIILFYAEFAVNTFSKRKITIIPKKTVFLLTLTGLVSCWLIIRNFI